MRRKPANPDALVAKWVAERHGVITTAALLEAGLTEPGIRRRVSAGRLHRLHRGVYAVGHAAISFEGRCLAAVLALGGGAVLSHRSAAELWGFMPRAEGPIHVTVPSSRGSRSRPGIIVHRSRHLDSSCTAFNAGVRLTIPQRTLADLRPGLDRELHDRATRKALDLGLISRRDAGSETALTRSKLERGFLALCRRHRLPKPRVNARAGPYEVDFLWPEQRVIVEADGFEFHRSREAFERDRARDAELQARGYRVVRVTHRQLRESPRKVARSVKHLLGAALPAP
ncbi:MAG: DUF559 domain-containing protein [Actinobacteria bacterium]|nr:DUF559 domain-containing protein [Actinomycetota bacterium]